MNEWNVVFVKPSGNARAFEMYLLTKFSWNDGSRDEWAAGTQLSAKHKNKKLIFIGNCAHMT